MPVSFGRVFAGVAALALVVGAPALAQAPGPLPDSRALIQSTIDATDGARALRFSSRLVTEIKAPGLSRTIAVPMSGEYQAPDRLRLQLSARPPREVVAEGTGLWSRVGEGSWQPTLPAALGIPADPNAWVRPRAGDYLLYATDPSVADDGGAYRLSGRLDIARALRESSGAVGVLRMAPIDLDNVDWIAATAELKATIQKPVPYLTELEVRINAPAPRIRGDVAMRLDFALADFDDPTIDVQPLP
jgi:hypothetical protein